MAGDERCEWCGRKFTCAPLCPGPPDDRDAELARLRADNAHLTAALEAADKLREAAWSDMAPLPATREAIDAYDRARRGER